MANYLEKRLEDKTITMKKIYKNQKQTKIKIKKVFCLVN
jgi:hypothetical protein